MSGHPDDVARREYLEEHRCPACDGDGRVPGGTYLVTRDMAMDAGEPDMAGAAFEEFGPCPNRCYKGLVQCEWDGCRCHGARP